MSKRQRNNSIIPNDDEFCFLCKRNGLKVKGTDVHHMVFGNSNRKLAEQDGLKCHLCHTHHMRLHQQQEHQLELKQLAEQVWLEHYNKTIEDWIKRYGKNYL